MLSNVQPKSFNLKALLRNNFKRFFLRIVSLISKAVANIKFIIVGLVSTVLIFYFKDLSIALGVTDRIPLILSIWAPVIVLSLFIFIGVLQINEK